MGAITPMHLILILVVALIVIGPGKLPETGAALGRAIRQFKDAADGVTGDGEPAPTQAPAQPQQPAAPYAAPATAYAAPAPAYVSPAAPTAAPLPSPSAIPATEPADTVAAEQPGTGELG